MEARRLSYSGRVLVWGCPRVGDVVMSIPALKILRRHAPELFVRYVTSSYARDVALLTGLVDEVRPFRLKGGICNFLRWRKLRREVSQGAYEHVFLFGKRTRFRRKIAERAQVAHTTESHQGHRAERCARVVSEALGLGDVPVPSVEIQIPEDPQSLSQLQEHGVDPPSSSYVVVHATCNRVLRKGKASGKLWPAHKYGPLFSELARRHPRVRIVLVGLRAEKPWVDRHVVHTLPPNVQPVNLVGDTTILELVQLLKHASVVLSGDSGVMHLATMTATQVVALFGPTNENRTGPYAAGDRAVKIRAMDRERAKKDPHCMDRISVEEVFQAIDTQLKRGQFR